LIVEGITRTTLGRATRIVNANFQKAPGCTNITTKPDWMTCLRRAQLFSHGLARRAKDRDRRGFETARIDRLVAADADAVCPFGDADPGFIDARDFIDVPAGQIIEQAKPAFIGRAVDAILIFLHGALFFVHMRERHHHFIAPCLESLVIFWVLNCVHRTLPQGPCISFPRRGT
jgi:hypothetical protein